MLSISKNPFFVWMAAATIAGLAWPFAAEAGAARVVHVLRVARDAGANIEWVPASAFPIQQAIVSTRIAASVQAVPVHEGDAVKQGQLLVRLDARELHAASRAAKVALDNAQVNERRMNTLLEANAVPQTAVDKAVADRAEAEAEVQLAEANLQYAELRAPFDGRVQARKVLPGDFVGPGQPLIELQGSAVELHAAITDAQAETLKPGGGLSFQDGDWRGTATVRSITPGSDALAHRRGLIATVEGQGPVRPGDFARIALPATGAAALWVPRQALTERGDLDGVFVVDQGRAALRWLSLGAEDGGRVRVRAGLKPGEAVVLDPGDLRDSEPVEVADGR